MSTTEFYSPTEIAEKLKLNRTTVYALIRRGELPSSKVGKQVRVSAADLEGYIASKKIGQISSVNQPKNDKQGLPEPPADTQRSGAQRSSIIIAGQDRSLDLLIAKSASVRRKGSPNLLRSYLGSYNGLTAMYTGKTTACGAHLWDAETDSYNVPYIKRLLPGIPCGIITIGGRRYGFYVKKGNPKRIFTFTDLAREGVRIANRERGSGTRILLDQKLRLLGIHPESIRGYMSEETTHLSVIGAVARGEADAGLGCEQSAAAIEEIEFVPTALEQLDFVYRLSERDRPLLSVMLDYLTSGEFKRDLSMLTGYDLSKTGKYIEV